jgi:hypothetical protein
MVSYHQSSKGGYHLLVLVRVVNWLKKWLHFLSEERKKGKGEVVLLMRLMIRKRVCLVSPSWFSGSGHCSLV